MGVVVVSPGQIVPTQLLGLVGQQRVIDMALRDLMTSVRHHWRTAVQQELRTTRGEYLRNLQPTEYLPGKATIVLTGVVPNMIENGAPRADLRRFLLGPKVPVVDPGERGKHAYRDSPGNYYRAIPFEHGTPRHMTVQPMGRQFERAYGKETAKKIGRLVYGRAKKLEATRGMPGQRVEYGGRLREEDIEVLMAKLDLPPAATARAVSIFSGMIRQEKFYEKSTQNTFMTFRMITTIKREGWIRQAMEGRKFAERTARWLEGEGARKFSEFFKELRR